MFDKNVSIKFENPWSKKKQTKKTPWSYCRPDSLTDQIINYENKLVSYINYCVEKEINENLLYSTGNFTQCSVVIKWEGNPKQRGHMYS